MKHQLRFWLSAGFAVLLLLTIGCSNDGTDAVFGTNASRLLEEGVTLVADPAKILLDPNDPEAPRDPDTNKLLGKTDLGAQVVDAEGNPMAGVEVTFSSSAGTLESGGSPVLTDDDGIATDTLGVDEDDTGDVEVNAVSGEFTGTVTVTVVLVPLNEPPVADAGEDQTVECPGVVTLDGSGSTDPNDDIESWEWFVGEDKIADGEIAEVELPVGTTVVTLVVTDATDLSDSDDVSITVEDTARPEVAVHLSPDVLWPPNHKMHDIEVVLDIGDCDGDPTVELLSVTSNEPPNANGDGNTEPDIMGVEAGADMHFQLRAERQGPGSGRIYTVVYRVTDASGNSTEAEATVTVPHDQGH